MTDTFRSNAGTPSISAMELRSNPGTVLDRVDYRNESFIIERAGKPKAVLIPVYDYQKLLRIKKEAKKNLFRMIDKIQERASQYDSKEIQSVIDKASGVSR